MTVILYAIPGFFLLMAIELAVDHYRQTGYYRLNDAIASLSIGMLSRVATIIKTLIPLSLYALFAADFALFQWADSWVYWLMAFVIYDFFYYWNHRLGHEMSVLWAAHVVHHSSEEYNLTTALRQTSGSILNWLFFIPMAFLGVPIEMMATVAALNLVYQFWVHTRHVGELGELDRILVTPSNHRVHHAQNDRYIDKNYGGVFIIWDRMFGTFQPELKEDPPIYGIRSQLNSWNPLFANWHHYRQLIHDSVQTKRWKDKFRVWFGRTGWRPDDVLAKLPPKARFNPDTFQKFEIVLSNHAKVYALIQLLLSLVLTVAILLTINTFNMTEQLVACTVLVLVLVAQGALLEGKSWFVFAESLKWLALGAMVVFMPVALWLSWTMIGLAIISAAWALLHRSDPVLSN
ncbi:sterol desaturase family protein [Alteromonas facilis]|uniref:sterol desaturase family protein n=1 Tax=Alteromonas facilis TaxID=2048004 RepID=UPI000C2830AF|nr:sterol desaturase family protein [Alteromonas facilis]